MSNPQMVNSDNSSTRILSKKGAQEVFVSQQSNLTVSNPPSEVVEQHPEYETATELVTNLDNKIDVSDREDELQLPKISTTIQSTLDLARTNSAPVQKLIKAIRYFKKYPHLKLQLEPGPNALLKARIQKIIAPNKSENIQKQIENLIDTSISELQALKKSVALSKDTLKKVNDKIEERYCLYGKIANTHHNSSETFKKEYIHQLSKKLSLLQLQMELSYFQHLHCKHNKIGRLQFLPVIDVLTRAIAIKKNETNKQAIISARDYYNKKLNGLSKYGFETFEIKKITLSNIQDIIKEKNRKTLENDLALLQRFLRNFKIICNAEFSDLARGEKIIVGKTKQAITAIKFALSIPKLEADTKKVNALLKLGSGKLLTTLLKEERVDLNRKNLTQELKKLSRTQKIILLACQLRALHRDINQTITSVFHHADPQSPEGQYIAKIKKATTDRIKKRLRQLEASVKPLNRKPIQQGGPEQFKARKQVLIQSLQLQLKTRQQSRKHFWGTFLKDTKLMDYKTQALVGALVRIKNSDNDHQLLHIVNTLYYTLTIKTQMTNHKNAWAHNGGGQLAGFLEQTLDQKDHTSITYPVNLPWNKPHKQRRSVITTHALKYKPITRAAKKITNDNDQVECLIVDYKNIATLKKLVIQALKYRLTLRIKRQDGLYLFKNKSLMTGKTDLLRNFIIALDLKSSTIKSTEALAQALVTLRKDLIGRNKKHSSGFYTAGKGQLIRFLDKCITQYELPQTQQARKKNGTIIKKSLNIAVLVNEANKYCPKSGKRYAFTDSPLRDADKNGEFAGASGIRMPTPDPNSFTYKL